MTMIEMTAVGRMYRTSAEEVWAVRDVTLTIPEGAFVALYGVSGSGKSTLLNLVAGLDVATSGQVLLDGADLGRMSEDERARVRLERVGVVFQDHNLIEEFTALENVMLPLEARGMPVPEARSAGRAALERVGLDRLEDRLPGQMSGGQRQRIGVARALAGDRRVLLADEPSGSLDSVTSLGLFGLLREIADAGATVVVATHDPRVRDVADVSLEMLDGRLLAPAAVA